jgi:hypothetical protein
MTTRLRIDRRGRPHNGAQLCPRHSNGAVKVWDGETGLLHRELEDLLGSKVMALASFLSPDGQQVRLVGGTTMGHLRVCDPEAGAVLHRLTGHVKLISDVACIASSSAAPHHPRLVTTSWDRTAKVWDTETGVMLADLRGHEGAVTSVAVWKEHHGGHDRIATASYDDHVKVWDGEAFTLLHDLDCNLIVLMGGGLPSAGGGRVWPAAVCTPYLRRRSHRLTKRQAKSCHRSAPPSQQRLNAPIARILYTDTTGSTLLVRAPVLQVAQTGGD